MNPDDLVKILDELGRRLGPAGEHVFELAVRQVYIDGITAIILTVAFVVTNLILWPRVARYIEAGPRDGERGIAGFLLALLDLFIGALVAVWFLIAAPAMLNPEYAALKDILSTIGAS